MKFKSCYCDSTTDVHDVEWSYDPNKGPSSGPRSGSGSSLALCRSRRDGGDCSPFNLVIVLCGPSDSGGGTAAGEGGFDLYYDNGAGRVFARVWFG